MPITLDMYMTAKKQQEIGWKPPAYETQEEELQKLGSPERLPHHYILLIAELEKWRADFLYS